MIRQVIKNGLKNGTALLFQRQKTILSGASVIGVMVLISAVLGLVRRRLYAGILAAGPEYDTLVAAFKIPDLIFQLLVVGSLNAAFIPLFSRYIVEDKAERAWKFASAVLNLTLMFFLMFAAVGFVFAPQLSRLLVPGFSSDQQRQLVRLMRIIILSPLFLGVSSFVGGIVQSFKRFFLPFFSPVVYNLGAILGILFLYSPLGIEGMAWGVLIGSILHLLVGLPLLRYLGFKYYFYLPWRDSSLYELLRLALPRTLWAAINQIKEVVVVNLASLLSVGSISVLDYGQAIVRFPILVFGASIAQASLPTLSEYAAREDMEKFRPIFLNSMLQVLYLVMPVSVVFIVLKIPIVRLIFGTGNFAWWETVVTSWVVALFALSLFAQAVKELIVRSFYALRKADTPVLVGVFSTFLGIVLAALLATYLGVKGLVLGLSIGFIVEFLILVVLSLREMRIRFQELVWPVLKIVFSSLLMAVAMYVPVQILDQVFIDTTRVVNLVVLVWVVLTFGGSVYLLLTWLLGCAEIRIFFLVLLKIRDWREAITNMGKLPVKPSSFDGEEVGGVE